MIQDFMQSKLPPVYKRKRQKAYLDPIRQKLILVTPEETVRQHMISWLIDEIGVPKNLLSVEEQLSHYGKNLRGRADIIIEAYDEDEELFKPVAVIECKAQEVPLDDKAFNQMFRYADKLDCEYCALTNGNEMFCYHFDGEDYVQLDELPTYREMLQGEYSPAPIEEPPPRIPFDKLEKFYWDYVEDGCIGEQTSETLQIPLTNFYECLLDLDHKFPARRYKIFRIVEDYGIRNLSIGDSSGGEPLFNSYRSFIVEYNGDTKFVSISVLSYSAKTFIGVAIDRDETPHHSLLLVVDKNVEVVGNEVKIFHDWSMTVGNKGKIKHETVKNFVAERYPKICHADRCFLGKLTHDRLWTLDDPEVIPVIENLIAYALIRDELRAIQG